MNKIKLIKWPKSKRKQLLDQWYDDAMMCDACSEEAKAARENIVEIENVENNTKSKLDPNTILTVGGSLIGTVLIINAEKVVLLSKNAMAAIKPISDLAFKIIKH